MKVLLEASWEVGLEVNTEQTKFMVMFHHQNAGQNHNLMIANKSFKKYGRVQMFENNSNKSKLHS
jgi:hypothetical protein